MKKGLLIALVILFAVGLILFFWRESVSDEKGEEIATWREYALYANASDYEKKLFEQLDDEQEEEELAKLIFKLFVANFYSLDLATSNSDVRGVQFVYEPFQEDFVKQARETVYERVGSNIFASQREELPMVVEVEIHSVEESSFLINEVDETFDSYVFRGELFYDQDPEYEKELEVELIINDERFDVVRMDTYLTN